MLKKKNPLLENVNLQSLHLSVSFFPGVGAASSGKLTFMVGGAEEEFTAAKELLSCMGTNVIYCGQVGTGQVRAGFHTEQSCLGSLSS